MKTVVFLERDWVVPAWAQWISLSGCGVVTVHQNEPKFTFDKTRPRGYLKSDGEIKELFIPTIMSRKI